MALKQEWLQQIDVCFFFHVIGIPEVFKTGLAGWLHRISRHPFFSGVLVNQLSEKKKIQFVVFSNFLGVNTTTTIDFRLPMCHH